jgi:hypothetical protein
MAAYRRVSAEALLMLIDAIDAGCDLAVARRSSRGDKLANQLQRRMVHALVRTLVGGSFRDLGSGVRAIRSEVLGELPLYGEFSRFLPLFALREGFRVEDIEVPQHPSDQRTRVYTPGVYIRRLLDLLAVFFLIRFREKPLRFFGLVGGLVSFAGLVVLAVLAIQRLAGEPTAAEITGNAITSGRRAGGRIEHRGARDRRGHRVPRPAQQLAAPGALLRRRERRVARRVGNAPRRHDARRADALRNRDQVAQQGRGNAGALELFGKR